jgi:putative nucleotidyltransferase with HDIG domain
VAAVLARLLPAPTGGLSTAGWWAAVLATSFAFLFVMQRLVHKLLPLALLLRLTLTFPDRAPSRFRVARQSGNLAELRAQLKRAGEVDDPDGLQQAAETILALAAALNTHDKQTRGHSERVRVFADMLAEELKLPAQDRDRLRWAALLHDIGKLEVPAEILNKPEALDVEEWRTIRRHPQMGMKLLGPLGAWLGPQAKTVQDHHERYDGDGYPTGIEGEEISLGGRIVAVADAYDTMTAARPYKKSLSAATAREELSRCAGKQFDPVVVRALMDISLGRLWWRVGILAWLAQIPLLEPVTRLVARSAQTATVGASAATVAAVIALSGIAPIPTQGPEPESYQLAEAPAPLSTELAPRDFDMPSRTHVRRAPDTAVDLGDPVVIDPVIGSSSSDGPREEAGNNDGGEGDPGGGGQGGGGGSGGDPSLIRQVVETVQEVVDELPPV